MSNVNEIRIKAIKVIEDVVRLQYNVNNGCYSDMAELSKQKGRLEGIKKWAVENDQIQSVRHFFASNNFGQPFQFIASDLANFFHN